MASRLVKRFPGTRACIAWLCLLCVVPIAIWACLRGNPVTNEAAKAISVSEPLQPLEPTADSLAPVAEQATGSHALEPVLALARRALSRMQDEVDDYTGRMIKRERINGTLGSEVQMEFKIRTRRESDGRLSRPTSAYLKFLEPKSARGREVIWTEGANKNRLTGHEGGFLNLMRVELEPTGMLAMMDNKYPITEIGLTRLIEKLIEKGERDRKVGPCEVQIVEDQRVGDRVCQLIQVTHPERDPRYDFHIAQIFIDTERMIPLRYAAFLWPQKAGGEPLLEEEYTYLDVKLNVGLTDTDFDPNNSDYQFP